MIRFRKYALALLATAASTAMVAPAHAGPVSTLYLTNVSSKSLYTVQGDVVTGSAPTYCNHCEQPIAVYGDVRTMGNGSGFGGRYNLDLTQTGTTYVQSTSVGLVDGATDGRRNYAVAAGFGGNPSGVYSFDREWGDPTLLFLLDDGARASGITYDPTNDTLWLQATVDTPSGAAGELRNYQMDGRLMTSLSDLVGGALAMDYADSTLWVVRGPTQYFDQYSRSGMLLQTTSYAGLVGKNGTGAEFDLAAAATTVPEPASLVMALTSLAGLGMVSRRRRSRS
ncbi:PEP-CTERM sorting domain-containing protein [Roseateles sp. P5_D6]